MTLARSTTLLAVLALTAPGCALDAFEPVLAGGDAGRRDGGRRGMDAGRGDAGAADDDGGARTDAGDFDGGSISPGDDAGRPDAGGFDAGAPDAGPPDAGPPDAGAPDAGAPDAGPPDAGRPGCTAIYGSLPNYMTCDERASECEFYMESGGALDCNAACSMGGGTCIDAYNELDSVSAPCTRAAGRTCGTNHNDIICICTRP